jgi:hypothetical protein
LDLRFFKRGLPLIGRIICESSIGLQELLVLETRDWGDGIGEPGVLDGLRCAKPFVWVQDQTAFDKVYEGAIFGRQDLLEPFAVGDPHNTLFLILDKEGRVVNVEVVLLLPAPFY